MLSFSDPISTFLLFLLITPAALCQSPPPPPSTPSVATPQGIYHPDTSIPGVEQFLGIPYAEPPLGALRFAAPVPFAAGDPAQHVGATRYGPACLQDPLLNDTNGLSEDCLTLNIYRPASSTGATTTTTTTTTNSTTTPPPLLPILVFLYGGANLGGQPRWYNAPSLVQHSASLSRPIITATLNYRTGALGFLSNTLFARRGGGSMLNAGLQDQRLALRWLRDNAARFGGDAARVVVLGQSAGSFDVWMQVRYERLARERGGEGSVLAGAVMESGGPGSLALRGLVPRRGDAYLRESLAALGCSAAEGGGEEQEEEEALACLRGVGAAELMRVWFCNESALVETLDEFVQMPTGFGVDGEWVTSRDYWDEEVAQIPMIIGDTLNEGSLYGLVPTEFAGLNDTYLAQVVATNLQTNNLTLAHPVIATYRAHTAAQNGRGYAADPTAPDSYYVGEAVLGDAVQDIPRRVNLARHAAGLDDASSNNKNSNGNSTATNATGSSGTPPGGAPTWGYRWAQKPPLSLFNERFYNFPPDVPTANKVRTGVLHAAELAYVFGDVRGWADAEEGDRRLADLVQAMWISFAYDLDPNNHGIPDVPHWDNYNPLSAAIFNFEDQGSTTPSMIPDDMRLDSYNAYKEAAAKAGLPPLPDIRV